MDIINLGAINNQDFSFARDISSWVNIYPNANLRMQMRSAPRSPIIMYQWVKNGQNTFNGKITIDAGIALIFAPVSDLRDFSGTYYYDFRLEDTVSNHYFDLFGGTIKFADGVTIDG